MSRPDEGDSEYQRKIEVIKAIIDSNAKTFRQVADLLDRLKRPLSHREMVGSSWDEWLKWFFSKRTTAPIDQLIRFCTEMCAEQMPHLNVTRAYVDQKIRQRCKKLGLLDKITESKSGPKRGSKKHSLQKS